MKRAKKRMLPTVAKLASSIRRTDRSLTKALAFCFASNKRIAKKGKRAVKEAPLCAGEELTLDEMLTAFDPKRHGGEVTTKTPRKKYRIEDLLAECDPNSLMPIDEEWERMRPVGKEMW